MMRNITGLGPITVPVGITHTTVENDRAVITVEASTAGLPPGYWPTVLHIQGAAPGDRMSLIFDHLEGEISAVYKNIHGDRLVVLND